MVKYHSDRNKEYTENETVLLYNIIICFVWQDSFPTNNWQTNVTLLADLSFYPYEAEFIQYMVKSYEKNVTKPFNYTNKYIDDTLCPKFSTFSLAHKLTTFNFFALTSNQSKLTSCYLTSSLWLCIIVSLYFTHVKVSVKYFWWDQIGTLIVQPSRIFETIWNIHYFIKLYKI